MTDKSLDEMMADNGLEPHVDKLPKPQMDTRLPNSIRFQWPGPTPIRIRAESIWKDRQGIHCWLTFHTHANGIIYGPCRINLQSASAIRDLRKELREREPQDWAAYLQHVSYLTSEHLRNEGETLTAASYKPKPEPPWLVWPLVKADVVNTCFADGGAGKSTLYVAVCLSLAAGQSVVPGLRVEETAAALFVDFEASPDDVIGAAQALALGANLPDGWQERFIYRRMGGSLSDNIETIQRVCIEHDVRLTVIDSLVGSAGSDPNDAETARVFFAASNSIPHCAIVGLTHVSKGSEDSPLGSVMYRNLPRIVWQMKRDEDSNTVGLIPNKINTLGTRPKAFALSLDTSDGMMRYRPADMGSAPELAKKLTNPERVIHVLRDGALSVSEIAEETGIDEAVIRTTLNRGKGKRFIQQAATGTWGLMAHNTDQPPLIEPSPNEGEVEGVTHQPLTGVLDVTPDQPSGITVTNQEHNVESDDDLPW